MRTIQTLVAFAAVLLIAACTLEDGAGPALTGPSEFALSVSLSATPDQLPRDGSSQSVITVTVRDASSRPVAGQRLTVLSDVGTLSATDMVTNGGGQASVTFTAPEVGSLGNAALIFVTPIGTNAGNAVPRTLSIGFIGPANERVPKPEFSVTPNVPEVNAVARFDASATTDEEDKPCLGACLYFWDFGDGATDAGRIVNHVFTVGRIYTVTLTVIDAAGTRASIAKSVTVNRVAAPTVTSFTVSPTSPIASQLATFTVKADPASGHSIQTFDWNFGDGTTQTTTVPTVVKSYSASGAYVVTVTVTDDLGQTGSSSMTVTVGSGIVFPQPPFTVSPASPVTSQTVSFNGSGVTTLGGSTITQYDWDFGDGTTATGAAATVTKSGGYATAGSYVVRLTVTDSAGRTGTATVSVSVTAP
jgi:PKD repeat protein